jgi:hypothetical protein
VHHRPLAFVLALAAGDYLLWNWSLAGGHDVVALISGLTLPPLAVALVGLLVLNAARLLAHSALRQVRGTGASHEPAQDPEHAARRGEQAPASSKLAA